MKRLVLRTFNHDYHCYLSLLSQQCSPTLLSLFVIPILSLFFPIMIIGIDDSCWVSLLMSIPTSLFTAYIGNCDAYHHWTIVMSSIIDAINHAKFPSIVANYVIGYCYINDEPVFLSTTITTINQDWWHQPWQYTNVNRDSISHCFHHY